MGSEQARLSDQSLDELREAFTPLSIGSGGGGSARARARADSELRRSPDSDEAGTPGLLG